MEQGLLLVTHQRIDLRELMAGSAGGDPCPEIGEPPRFDLHTHEVAVPIREGDGDAIRQVLAQVLAQCQSLGVSGLALRVVDLPAPDCEVQFQVTGAVPGAPETGSATLDRAFAGSIGLRLWHYMGGEYALTVKRHEGKEPPCGWVTLTLSMVLEPHLDRSTSAPGRPAGPLIRVLLVEDNPVNADMTAQMLATLGQVEVTLSPTGEDAVHRMLQKSFDVVLMDMFLPDTDGVVVARKIRRILGLNAPPIIALTANGQASDRQLCLESGMVDFLMKPVPLQTLCRVVEYWSGRGGVAPVNA